MIFLLKIILVENNEFLDAILSFCFFRTVVESYCSSLNEIKFDRRNSMHTGFKSQSKCPLLQYWDTYVVYSNLIIWVLAYLKFIVKFLRICSAPENMKKPPSKVTQNFVFVTGLAAQMAQKQKSRTTKSPLMQDWVFGVEFKYFLEPYSGARK